MTINPTWLLSRPAQETSQCFTRRDTILYALGVGAEELPFTYEEGLQALPSMAVMLAYPGFFWRESQYGANWKRLVHGETGVDVLAPLPIEGDVVGLSTFESVEDKGIDKGAIVRFIRRILDGNGRHIATVRSASFLRGDGGCGSMGTPPAALTAVSTSRPADHVVTLATASNQALIYRLSGDLNPMHIDPAVAMAGGFSRPILHGLCTYGVACRAVLKALANNDPLRVKRLDVRFSAPVYPGDTIRTEIWQDGAGKAKFRALALERGTVVLNNGIAEFT